MMKLLSDVKKLLNKPDASVDELDEISKDTQIHLLSVIIVLLLIFIIGIRISLQLDSQLNEEYTVFSTSYYYEDKVTDPTKSMIDLNSNDVNELMKIPGIGNAKAQAIIEYRKENGNFDYIEEVKYVKGIGDKIFEGMKDYIYVLHVEKTTAMVLTDNETTS